MKTLTTERMLLREWQLSDAGNLYEYARSPLVGPMAGWKPHESIEESRNIIEMFIREGETWALCDKRTGKTVGSVGLHVDRKRELPPERARMLGYVLAEEYWGKGIMPEVCTEVLRFAFEELKLEILSVFHFPFNQRSRRVIEKLGFVREGTIRKSAIIYDGSVLDDVVYSMTREEYSSRQQRHIL